jgi:hypothetical protein
MSARLLVFSVATVLALGASPAIADHNSKNGEGWANMPNDIHNTRIDTREAKDNEAFREFVQYGEGSDSVNRFADEDDTTAKRAQEQQGKSSTERTQTQTMQGTRTNERSSTKTRTRLDKASSSTARQRSAMQEQRSQRPGRQADNRRPPRGRR